MCIRDSIHIEPQSLDDERAEARVVIEIRPDVPTGEFRAQLIDRSREKIEVEHRRARRPWRLFAEIERCHGSGFSRFRRAETLRRLPGVVMSVVPTFGKRFAEAKKLAELFKVDAGHFI